MATNLAARRGNGAQLQRSAPAQPAATGNTIATLLQDPRVVSQMALALPKHMTAERLARIALTEVRKNPQLAKADQASFLGAIMQCAALGLEPGGALGHAYLIPYGREVQFVIGYRGMIDLARRSGQILSIEAHVVHEADSFSCRLGLDPDLQHEPAWDAEDPGELRFVYAVAKLKDGGTQFEVMSRAQVEAIRKRSKASKNGPWVTDFESMSKKTVIRQLFKYLPVSIELAQAVGYDEQADLGTQDNPLAHLVSAAPAPEALPEATAKAATVATPVISAEQLEALNKGISRRLSAIGESAMFRETTEALGIDGLELLPVDQFDVVMGMLANADICRNWNEGSASNGAALLSPEDIEALQVAEAEAAPEPAPAKGKAAPAPAPAADVIPGLPDEDDDQGEFL